MNRRFIYIILTSIGLLLWMEQVSAQHYLGVRAGFGSGSSRFYPERVEKKSVSGLWSGGLSWKYLGPEKVLNAIQVDLLFIQQGFGYEGINAPSYIRDYDGASVNTEYKRTVNSLMVPVFWHPHVYLFRQRLRVFLNAGVTFSYNISSKYEWHSEDGRSKKGTHHFYVVQDNRWGYGLCAGGGLGFSFDRWEVVAEFRYYIGYSDILKNRNKYYPNGFLRTPLDQIGGSVGLYYRLGRGGILSEPSPKTKLRIEEWERRQVEAGKMKSREQREADEQLRLEAKAAKKESRKRGKTSSEEEPLTEQTPEEITTGVDGSEATATESQTEGAAENASWQNEDGTLIDTDSSVRIPAGVNEQQPSLDDNEQVSDPPTDPVI